MISTWASTRLDRVATVNARIGWKALTAAEYQDDGYAFLATPNIKSETIDFDNVNFISEFRYEESPELRLRPGDVLLAKDGSTLGIANVVRNLPRPATVNGSVAVLRPFGIEARYLMYALRGSPVQEWIAQVKDGMGVPHLFQADIKKFGLPLPPPENQRRIADFLDDQVARIDNIITIRQRQIVLEQELFEHEREQMIELGPRLKRRQLGQLTVASRPINYGVLMPGPRLDVGVPLVEAGDVMRGPLVLDELRLTEPAIEADFARSRLRSGDLVMAIRGSIGAVQVVPNPKGILNVTRDAARISLDDDVADAAYVRHAMSTRRVQEWFGVRVLGSAVTGINIGDLRKVPISLPTRPEQRTMVRKLDDDELRTARVAELMMVSISRLRDLKRSLITAAVTGEFDVSTADGSRVSA